MKRTLTTAAIAALIAAGTAQAQPYGSGMGPGMMGPGYGMGPEMMGGYRGQMGPGYGPGPGYGMGPGMMGPGYGMGPGMMGPGYGMGPGMMGPGYGMGPGMMRGYGGGPGMMWGYGPGGADLNLNEEQRKNIGAIQDEMHQKHHGLMQQMWDVQNKLRELHYAENRDVKAINEQYARLYDLRRMMAQSAVEAQDRMEKALTPEQRKLWRRMMP